MKSMFCLAMNISFSILALVGAFVFTASLLFSISLTLAVTYAAIFIVSYRPPLLKYAIIAELTFLALILYVTGDPAILLILIGGTMNLAAIAPNGWKMPVLVAPGEEEYVTDARHMPLTAETRVWPLCDILWGYSVGDIILVSGYFAYSFR